MASDWMSLLLVLVLVVVVGCSRAAAQPPQQLSPDFYSQTCPNLSSIASSSFRALTQDNVVSPSVIRLINHDCFIQGCDGSILISSTPENKAERDNEDNDIPQQAFDAINMMKSAAESACPGIVSCADIVALAAQEAVVFLNGPSWQVPLGRRDSLTSLEANVEGNIPRSNLTVEQLLVLFSSKGLDLQDLVALSGAHTIGFSKCRQFSFRLHQSSDPSLDPSFAQDLENRCTSDNVVVPFDTLPFTFDTSYFSNLQLNKGLLATDQALFNDNNSRPFVESFGGSQAQFFQAFVNSMMKMSSIGVLTGNAGEIRRDCTKFNSGH